MCQKQVVQSVHTELVLSITDGKYLVWQELKEELKNTVDCLGHNDGVSRTFTLAPQSDIEEQQCMDDGMLVGGNFSS